MKFNTLYLTINHINQNEYIGIHLTENLFDSYLGSGKYLNNAIKKYGKENFEKITIGCFRTYKIAQLIESWLVDDEYITRPDTYNIKLGGIGGFDYINSNGLTNYKKGGYSTQRKIKNNPEIKTKISKGLKHFYSENINPFKGKKHTNKTKRKIGFANSKHQQGKGNSQYGTCWCVKKDAKNLNDKIKFKKDKIPEDYITTTEWRENKKRKSGSYGRKWYTNGKNNMYLSPTDNIPEGYYIGRTLKH